MRIGDDGTRRPDARAQLITDDGELILFRYDVALIRSSQRFLAALAAGQATEFEDQYMRVAPQFEVGAGSATPGFADSLFRRARPAHEAKRDRLRAVPRSLSSSSGLRAALARGAALIRALAL